MPDSLKATLNATLNFLPLMLLWGISNQHAFWAALAAASGLILLNIVRKSFNIKPIVLFLYLGLSVILYHYLKIDFVLSQKQLISSLVLGSMGLISILLNKPYTMYFAQSSYDKAFAKSPLFIEVNILITKIWTAVHFINAVMEAFNHSTYTVVITNLLVAIGIASSIMIPSMLSD